ncbi:MAG: twin-arginine translocation signal domain-containing protein, partial [Alloacidobacterium sp.]
MHSSKELSRRRFLTTAGASAAALLLPVRVFGSPTGDEEGKMPRAAAPFAWQNKGVIDISNSPYARLKTVPVSAV